MSNPDSPSENKSLSDREKELEKLKEEQLNALSSWGIRRQLSWSVFTVTSLLALITLYYQIHNQFSNFSIVSSSNLSEISNLIVTNLSDSFGFWGIFVIAMIGLIFCEIRTVNYYQYISLIDKIWLKTLNKNIKIDQKKIFLIGSPFHRFMMSKYAKFILVFVTLILSYWIFIHPLLF